MVDPGLNEPRFGHARQSENPGWRTAEPFKERVSRSTGEQRPLGLIEDSSSHPVSQSGRQGDDRRNSHNEVHPGPTLLGHEVPEQLGCVPTRTERRRIPRDLLEGIGEQLAFTEERIVAELPTADESVVLHRPARWNSRFRWVPVAIVVLSSVRANQSVARRPSPVDGALPAGSGRASHVGYRCRGRRFRAR